MSLHLNQQCQRADAHPPPVRLVPGIGYTDQEEARNERETSLRGRVRLLEGHICVALRPVNPGFYNIVAVRRCRRFGPPFREASSKLEMGMIPARFNATRLALRRSGYRPASPRPRPR